MAANLQTSSLTKAQKAALIFLLLEERGASSLFEQMSDVEIKRIGSTLLTMQEIPVGEMSMVLSEFYMDMGVAAPDQFSGKRIFEKMVDKTLSSDRKSKILNVKDIKGGLGSKQNPLEDLFSDMTGEQVFKMIKNEHQQTIAVILTLIKPSLAKEVLAEFEAKEQTAYLYRMSMLSKVPEDMIQVMAENFHERMTAGGAADEEEVVEAKAVEVPGVDLVLRFLKSQEWAKAEEMISQIEIENADIAAVLRKKFFILEDLLRADNNGVRNLLRTVETATLSVALKSQTPEVQDIFFQNMSTRAATILKEDMEVMPAQKEEDVEVAAEKILAEAKKLILEGQMILSAVAD